MAASHPGFKAVQASIAKKEGIGAKAAGAILAAKTREASPKAVQANPRLAKVRGTSKSEDHKAEAIGRRLKGMNGRETKDRKSNLSNDTWLDKRKSKSSDNRDD